MKRTWAIMMIVLAAAALSGCGLLSASLFPAHLSLAIDAISVADLIGDPVTTETDLSVLKIGGAGDLLFLVVRRPGQSETLTIVATDPLQVLGGITRDDLNLVTGLLGNEGRFGRLRMIDADLNYVVGNFIFSPDLFAPPLQNYTQLNTGLSLVGADDIGFAIYSGNEAGWNPGGACARRDATPGRAPHVVVVRAPALF